MFVFYYYNVFWSSLTVLLSVSDAVSVRHSAAERIESLETLIETQFNHNKGGPCKINGWLWLWGICAFIKALCPRPEWNKRHSNLSNITAKIKVHPRTSRRRASQSLRCGILFWQGGRGSIEAIVFSVSSPASPHHSRWGLLSEWVSHVTLLPLIGPRRFHGDLEPSSD